MWLKVWGVRLKLGGCKTETSLRTSCNTPMKSPARAGSACKRMSKSENSIWRRVCKPLWKFLAANILSNSARGKGSPVSTWAVMWRSTLHSQQKFSMNWLGSSTASHSTPLMPETSRSLTCVSMWCRPWPHSWKRVITSSCVSSGGLPLMLSPKLHTRCATGVCNWALSGRSQRARTSSIQAPPRLPARALGSR